MAVRFRTCINALLVAVAVVAVLTHSVMAATFNKPGFTESLVASGLASPTAMAFAPDGRLFVCKQASCGSSRTTSSCRRHLCR